MKTTTRWQIAQQAEIKWWRRYLRKKDKDSYYDWKKEYWRDFLANCKAVWPDKPELQILDAGCGPAGIFTILDRHSVTAVDPLLAAYNDSLEGKFDPAEYPNVRFVNSGLEETTFTEEFDVVFCLNAINHVSDMKTAFQKLADSAKLGGSVIISIDCHNHTVLKKIFQIVPGDILHPHQYDKEEYSHFAANSGLKVVGEFRSKPGTIFDYWVLLCKKAS